MGMWGGVRQDVQQAVRLGPVVSHTEPAMSMQLPEKDSVVTQ